ncbi:MAG: hypothetical protein R2796_00990 [Chitinophagaceae bacterium]
MMMALLWLTVSTPFVFRYQQEIKKTASATHKKSTSQNGDYNPFANAEEKTSSMNSFAEEYHHHTVEQKQMGQILAVSFCTYTESLYVAFHGEQLSPPPDFI